MRSRGKAVSEPISDESALDGSLGGVVRTLSSMERDEVESESQLLEGSLSIRLLESNPTGSDDTADERRGVGERPGIEWSLVGEVAEAVEDTGDETCDGFGGKVLRDDVGLDGPQD
jgi:hypothetical protein